MIIFSKVSHKSNEITLHNIADCRARCHVDKQNNFNLVIKFKYTYTRIYYYAGPNCLK